MAGPVSYTLTNLIQGVSQRPDGLRSPEQAQAQVNGYSTIGEGLRKRPGTRLLAEVADESLEGAFVHSILRDTQEKYIAVFTREAVRVYELDGTPRSVNYNPGLSYLAAAASPDQDYRVTTAGDYTFLSNVKVLPAMDGAVAPQTPRPKPHEALIWVRQAEYGALYEVTVNAKTIKVSAPAQPVIDPDGVTVTNPINASTIAALIAQELPPEVEKGRDGAVIWIRDDVPITIKVPHAVESRLDVVTTQIDSFTNLPAVAPAGYLVDVTGDPARAQDDYYLEFVVEDGSAFGRGYWRETVQRGMQYRIRPETMPHALIRLADGSFWFGPLDGRTVSGLVLPRWGDRGAGDARSSPTPGFIGRPINDVFIWQNRLGLLADEQVILSRSGRFFEFFPPTATGNLADDPIELAASGARVSVLRYAVPFQNQMLLFSDQSQFLLRAGEAGATPATTTVALLTQYEVEVKCRPIVWGEVVIFVQPGEGFSRVREYRVTSTGLGAVSGTSADLTVEVPSYIPSRCFRLTADDAAMLLVVLSDRNDPTTRRSMWVNKSLVGMTSEGQRRLQNAWSVWRQPGVAAILEALAVEERLYLLTVRDSKTWLEVMDVADHQPTDDGQPIDVHLDAMVTEGADTPLPLRLAPPSYDVVANKTTWTLPLPLGEPDRLAYIVTDPVRSTMKDIYVLGTSDGGTTIEASGDWRGEAVIAGQSYRFRYRFSRFRYVASRGGTLAPSNIARTQIRRLTVRYDRTSFFQARVLLEGRSPAVYKFDALVTGARVSRVSPVETFQAETRYRGLFSIPVLSDGEKAQVELWNETPAPCRFLSAEWVGLVSRKGVGR